MYRLDAIVFGATGFTGKYICTEVNRHAQKRPGFTWGIAGRSEDKLKKVIQELEKKTEQDLSNIPLIVSDIADDKSLVEMAKQAKLIINSVGPFRLYGEPIVKACIEGGAHHVDISGEPEYMEKMQVEYNEKAKEKGVYIISSCGFDSIPAEMGTIFIKKKFEGIVNSVETYLQYWTDGSLSGAAFNNGTWDSAVYSLSHANELKSIRNKLYPEPTPKFKPHLKRRCMIHKNDAIGRNWCVPLDDLPDLSVVNRTERYFYDNERVRPIQMEAYLVTGSTFYLLMMGLFGGIFKLFTKFKAGCNLLVKYPRFFSMGFFSNEGPKEEELKKINFSITFYVKGWSDDMKLDGPSDQTIVPNKTLVAKLQGKDPAYSTTSKLIVISGLTILDEIDKLPETGGVLPPGAVFSKTSLTERLIENGVFTLEILNVKTEDNK